MFKNRIKNSVIIGILASLMTTSAMAGEIWYTNTSLNCRREPSMGDNIITTYDKNTPLEIIGIDPTGIWWQTWDGNIQGWCKGEYFSIEENDDSTQTMTYVGDFRLTGYCPCYNCSEGYGTNTAMGVPAEAGVTIAASTRFPLGTKLYIEGVGYRIVQDRGGAIKGNRIDVYVDCHSECYAPNINCSAKVYEVK